MIAIFLGSVRVGKKNGRREEMKRLLLDEEEEEEEEWSQVCWYSYFQICSVHRKTRGSSKRRLN